jgi:hypothetical protein
MRTLISLVRPEGLEGLDRHEDEKSAQRCVDNRHRLDGRGGSRNTGRLAAE